MKVTILAVGKVHEPQVRPAITLYEERLRRFCTIEWQLLPHAGFDDPERTRKAESDAIRQKLHLDDTVILLDERGAEWSSPQLAQQLEHWMAHKRGQLMFIIGGAYGVDERLRQQAVAVWSLSRLVFPHQLVRVLLLEQLYRAQAINHNLPYHHI